MVIRLPWVKALFDNLAPINPQERRKLMPVFNDTPVWPARDSVKPVGDVTLVKPGDKPGFVHANTP